jgi:hypothetical protein
MRILLQSLAVVAIALAAGSAAEARQAGADRLPREVLDVLPPSAHVRGAPGAMVVQPRECRTLPTAQTRRRMVDVAVQEWAYFGFRVVDQTEVERAEEQDAADAAPGARGGRRRPRLSAGEAARVAASIAGYWAVTPQGTWIVERQNEAWKGPDGIAVRWNAPWSAAFISWVMCEAGLGASSQFQRAIAHHAYIDQAIRARDGRAPEAAFVAYDAGEAAMAPGDLLCSSRRPAYRTIADRRRQMGVGARSHCDVVVTVDEAAGRVLAIGGNVRGTVSLKIFPAAREPGRHLRVTGSGEDDRPMFAHLKLRAEAVDLKALDTSPTVKAFGCGIGTASLARLAAAPPRTLAARC